MWWSGLRGGVAFALASVSFSHDDFPAACGGIRPGHPQWEHCDGTSDSAAPCTPLEPRRLHAASTPAPPLSLLCASLLCSQAAWQPV